MKHRTGTGIPVLISLLVVILLLPGCRKYGDISSCAGQMFGRPVAATGLDESLCNPRCDCLTFTSRDFTLAELHSLKDWILTEPFPELTVNPYNQPLPVSTPSVCAVVIEDLDNRRYRLETFASESGATAAGAILTHYDACGRCSTLEDLAVYAGKLDVGADVKNCGLLNYFQPFNNLVACIQGLGFSKPCAQIWAYNVRNTQSKCADLCLNNDPYHTPDGKLSPCLRCDENKSGPVFKAIAGRTRRNTGIASSICRFCDEVQPVRHDYPY
jgi:hypothetical protein